VATREQIKSAVSDDEWQEFRKSLKGLSTYKKLDALQSYFDNFNVGHKKHKFGYRVNTDSCDVCIRVDNYLKALMRGGQLVPFLDLGYFVHTSGYAGRKWRDATSYETIDGLRRKVSVVRK